MPTGSTAHYQLQTGNALDQLTTFPEQGTHFVVYDRLPSTPEFYAGTRPSKQIESL